MNVLSLFDGISCGMVALERAGIKVDKYYASEIEPTAIKISEKNYPNIVRLGDVTKWREWDIDWASIDLLIGGSPCQGFSFAGQMLNFEDPRSKLFFEYVDILNYLRHFNPQVKFLLENVNMKKEYENIITEYLGTEPVRINSNKFVPMRRDRNYWFNWFSKDITTAPKPIRLFLDKDIKDSYWLSQDKMDRLTFRDSEGDLCVYNVGKKYIKVQENDGVIMSRTWSVYAPVCHQESHCFRAANPDDSGICGIKDGQFCFRKFTLSEYERLMTLPEGYTVLHTISERKSKSTIGNGWTVDVIAHIFKSLKS